MVLVLFKQANCVLSILSSMDSKIQSHTHFSNSLDNTAVEVIGFQPFIDCGGDLLGIAATGIFSRFWNIAFSEMAHSVSFNRF